MGKNFIFNHFNQSRGRKSQWGEERGRELAFCGTFALNEINRIVS